MSLAACGGKKDVQAIQLSASDAQISGQGYDNEGKKID